MVRVNRLDEQHGNRRSSKEEVCSPVHAESQCIWRADHSVSKTLHPEACRDEPARSDTHKMPR
jgi:hypothetical protein